MGREIKLQRNSGYRIYKLCSPKPRLFPFSRPIFSSGLSSPSLSPPSQGAAFCPGGLVSAPPPPRTGSQPWFITTEPTECSLCRGCLGLIMIKHTRHCPFSHTPCTHAFCSGKWQCLPSSRTIKRIPLFPLEIQITLETVMKSVPICFYILKTF